MLYAWRVNYGLGGIQTSERYIDKFLHYLTTNMHNWKTIFEIYLLMKYIMELTFSYK